MEEKIFFYYTNDIHSHFEHWSKITGYFKEKKSVKAANGQSCFLFDVGDHVDRFHPIAEAFKGKANVQLMNEAGYDIVTLGNNEGITLSHHDLYDLYEDANFEVVCANLKSNYNKNPNWLIPYTIIKTKKNVRIGVIGLTAPFQTFYNLLGWDVEFTRQALEREINHLRGHVDMMLLLSHMGINEDRYIAETYPEIDVIIGGHTHHLLRTGEIHHDTLLTAAGKNGAYVGEVILTWDHQTNTLKNKEAYTTNVTHMAKDLQTEQTLHELNEEANIKMNQMITMLENQLEVKWFKSTSIMESLTKTLQKWTQAECAMLNAGMLMDAIEAGPVTYKDVHRICPHPINPCVVEINGDELLEVIRSTITTEFMELKLKGLGFRGEVLGRMIFSGLEIETRIHEDGHESIKHVLFNQEPLDPKRIYSVATADTFTFGRILPEIARAEKKNYFLPEFIRDLLVITLKKGDF